MRRATNKTVCAAALGINRKNIYRQRILPDKDEALKQDIEAIHQHIHYYNHQRIHTALKMPPAVYAAQTFSDTCLQNLGT